MNKITGKVSDISEYQGVSFLTLKTEEDNITLKLLTLETPKKIEISQKIILGVKASSILLSKSDNKDILVSNSIKMQINDIDRGEIVSSLTLERGDILWECITPAEIAKKLNPKEYVYALFKANDITIMEIIDG